MLSHLSQKAAKRLREAGLRRAHNHRNDSLRRIRNHHACRKPCRSLTHLDPVLLAAVAASSSTTGIAVAKCAWSASN